MMGTIWIPLCLLFSGNVLHGHGTGTLKARALGLAGPMSPGDLLAPL